MHSAPLSSEDPVSAGQRLEQGPGHRRALRAGWLLAGCVVMLVAFNFDAAVDNWRRSTTSVWQHIANAISRGGNFPCLAAYGATLIALAWWRGRRRWLRLFGLMLLASSVAGLTADVVRCATGRARPNAKVAAGWYGLRDGKRWTITHNQYHAFPSAHTTCAAAFLAPLILRRRLFGSAGSVFAFAAMAGMSAMAWARVYLGVHHLSDVCAGLLLGCATAWILDCRPWFADPAGTEARK